MTNALHILLNWKKEAILEETFVSISIKLPKLWFQKILKYGWIWIASRAWWTFPLIFAPFRLTYITYEKNYATSSTDFEHVTRMKIIFLVFTYCRYQWHLVCPICCHFYQLSLIFLFRLQDQVLPKELVKKSYIKYKLLHT